MRQVPLRKQWNHVCKKSRVLRSTYRCLINLRIRNRRLLYKKRSQTNIQTMVATLAARGWQLQSQRSMKSLYKNQWSNTRSLQARQRWLETTIPKTLWIWSKIETLNDLQRQPNATKVTTSSWKEQGQHRVLDNLYSGVKCCSHQTRLWSPSTRRRQCSMEVGYSSAATVGVLWRKVKALPKQAWVCRIGSFPTKVRSTEMPRRRAQSSQRYSNQISSKTNANPTGFAATPCCLPHCGNQINRREPHFSDKMTELF